MAKDLSFDDFLREQDGAAISFDDFMQESSKPVEGGFTASVKQTVGSTIKGAGQLAADYIPGVGEDNAVKRYGEEVIAANPTAVRSLEDIKDKPWTAVKEATGNAGASVAGVVGARALGMGITAASPLAGPAAPAVALAGQAIAWFGPAAIAALPSYGSIREKQQINDPEANDSWKAKAIASLGAATVGAIETKFGPQEWALSALTKEGRKALAEKFAETTVAKAIGFGAMKGAAIEGAEELAQNPIEQLAGYDDPTTPESLKDTAFGGAMGALGGGVFGGGTGAMAGRGQNNVMTPSKPDVQDIGAAQNVDEAIAAADAVIGQSTQDALAATRAQKQRANLEAAATAETDRQAKEGELQAFMESENRNLQVARAQILEESRKARELDQIQQTGRQDLGRLPEQQVAAAEVATDETPTAMQLAMQRALARQAEKADVSIPSAVQPVPATPIVRGSSDTTPGMVANVGTGPVAERAVEPGRATDQPARGTVSPERGAAAPELTATQPTAGTPQNVQVQTPFSNQAAAPARTAAPAEQAAVVPPAGGTAAILEAVGVAEPQRDGTALIRGDVQKILEELKRQGFTAVLKRQGGVLVGRSQAQRALEVFKAPAQKVEQGVQPKPVELSRAAEPQQATPEQPAAPAPSARQVAIEAERARMEAKRAQRSAAAKEAAKPMEGLSVGSMPTNAEPVTVQGGVVYIGKYAAQNFDTGEDVSVPAGATPQQIADALKASGAMGKRARFFGLQNSVVDGVDTTQEAIKDVAEKGVDQEENAAVQALADLSDESLKTLAENEAMLTATNKTSEADHLRSLGATEQEIQDATQGQERTGQDAESRQGHEETAPSAAPRGAESRNEQARPDAESVAPKEEPAAQPEAVAEPAAPEKPISQMSAADLLRAAADKMEGKAEEKIEPTNSLSRTASWVIKNKETGDVVMETFDKKKVDALNTKKYEAVPIQEHLASLSEKPPKAEPQEPMFSRAAPVWRSALRDGVATITAKAQDADGWRAQIQGLVNKGSVKADEVEWSGVTDWLQMQTGKVTKEQLLGYLDGNGVQVQEVVLADESATPEQDEARFGEIETRLAELGWTVDGDSDTAMIFRFVSDSKEILPDQIPDGRGEAYDLMREAVALNGSLDDVGVTRTKYGTYTLPGGENYREVLLTYPTTGSKAQERIRQTDAALKNYLETEKAFTREGARDYALDAARGELTEGQLRFAQSDAEQMRLINAQREAWIAREKAASSEGFKSVHWDQQNVLAHIRVNDRTDADGKRVLFVEEIQSDWGQEGKKKGFRSAQEAKLERLIAERDAQTDDAAAEDIQDKINDLVQRNPGVPNAPFIGKTDAWLNLALKRIITMAAQEGYDRVAFINGQQSADRYDLSKQISKIRYADNNSGGAVWAEMSGKPSRGTLTAWDLNGKEVISKFVSDPAVELPDLIGKDAAEKLLTSKSSNKRTDGGTYARIKELSGLDLKVGGEGMKAFYDKIVPAAVKKLLPKIGGGQMGSVNLGKGEWSVQNAFGDEIYSGNEASAKSAASEADDYVLTPPAGTQPGFDITPAMREKAAQGLPMFSEGQLPAVITPSTVERVHAAITELLGGKQLSNSLGRIVATTAAEIKSTWEPLIGKNLQIGSEGEAGIAQAFFDPRTKTVFLIADHINEGTETAVLAHELMHKHGVPVLGEAGWDRLHSLIGTWKDAPEDSDERKVYDYAAAKVEAVGQELSTQELFPYAVEAAIKIGVKPSMAAKRGTVASWLESVRQNLKVAWGKITGKPETFKAQDLVDLAFGIAQMENPESAAALRGALDETKTEQNALRALSQNDELYALPKSDKTTLEGIAADNDPSIKVEKSKSIAETLYTITMPDGRHALVWVRPANPYGERAYSRELNDGEITNLMVGRPGVNPEDVSPDTEDVYLDVSGIKEGSGGNLAYNIAATFAHNTGRIFIGDPTGLSDAAMRRRTENMLSSALKFGTTRHLAPHPRQVKGDAKIGVPPMRWTYGDDMGNIRELIRVSDKALHHAGANLFIFDPQTGTFRDPAGRVIDDGAIRSIVERGRRPESRAGIATYKRNAVLSALVREESGQGGGRGTGAGILAQLVDVGRQYPASSKGIFYSRRVIVGETTRKHTPEQLRAMRNVGFEIEVPTLKERAQALWHDAGKKLAQGIVDQFAPVKDLDKEAYGLLRLAKGASGAFEVFLHGGRLKLTDGVYDFDDANKGGVIDKLLIPLQGEHHDFFRWIAANRAERLTAEGRENLFTAQDIADLKTLADGTTDFDYTVQTGPRAGTVTHDRTLIYADSQRVFNEFNRNVLDLAEQSGLIDGASRHLWENEFYVPFYRVADEDGGVRGANIKSGVVRQEAFKKLKGGTQELNADLLDNTLMNWAHLLDAAAKNRAAKATIEAAEKLGAATQVPSGTKKSVWFMDKGQKHHAVVDDPYLLTAITALEYAGMRNPVMNAMGTFKHYLTMGVTASPFFKVRNLIRDSMQVVATSGISPNVAANVGKGWALTNPQSDEYFRLMAGGGTIHFGTMLEGSEAKRVQALVESGVDDATILNDEHKVKQFYRKFIEPAVTAYNELGNRGEAINRASLYDQLRKQGMSHAEASLQARDLMDFSMQGSFTTIRFLTQVVPFFNARLQGMYKLGRAAKEDPKRMAAVIGATALFSLALLAAYSDDDDWKKRESWDRNNYWWFKFGGTAFRIPKPFEIGAMATLAERGFELMFDKEMTGKRFRKQVLTLLADNLSMNPVPQLVKPIMDVYANKDSFTGRPIETMGMDRLEAEYRFTNRTSMLARGASTAANAVTGLVGLESPSPVQIDHMLRGYFGWLGAFVVGSADTMLRPMTGQPDRATPDLWKVATGGMIANLDDAPSRYVSQMYEQATEIERAYATWRQLVKEGKTLEAGEYLQEHRDDIRKHRNVSAVKAQESRLNQRIRMIERSNMSPDKKRDQIKKLQEQKDRIARRLAD